MRSVVYEGAIETAEYMAEFAYLTDSNDNPYLGSLVEYSMAFVRFEEYVDDTALLEKYIVGGKYGISFLGSSFPDEDGYIDMYITYFVKTDVPVFGLFSHKVSEHIRQRAYLGAGVYTNGEDDQEEEKYVFVAENGTVYHSSRSCTYLMPSIVSSGLDSAKNNGYRACEYCGNAAGDLVYVTMEGDCYHSGITCSRLKRTVYRKKISEISLPPCSKCGE